MTKVTLSYQVPAPLKAKLQKLADADRRKLGPYIQIVLEDHVAAESSKKPKKVDRSGFARR
jgi:mRNA-degrading endonuclease RelE of RelBE toxin-antitoxin system